MKAIYKLLLEKSIIAMKSAVGIYNNPSISFKSEIYIVNAIIAWTYLLHAYYDKNGIDYHYYKKSSTGRKKYDKIDGRKKAWDISKCLQATEVPLSDAQRSNLQLLIKIRNEIEHTSINYIDDEISSYIMSCSINYNNVIKKYFHDKYSLDKEMGMAIQFSVLNPMQKKILKTKHNTSISKMISEFCSTTNEEYQKSVEFSYKVAFVPLVANKENQANTAITFYKTDSPETQNLNLFIKETEKQKYRPSDIVKLMKDKGYTEFTINKHTDMWKNEAAKRSDLGYGTLVSGTWYWYEKWVERVSELCKIYFS